MVIVLTNLLEENVNVLNLMKKAFEHGFNMDMGTVTSSAIFDGEVIYKGKIELRERGLSNQKGPNEEFLAIIQPKKGCYNLYECKNPDY